MKVLIVDDEPLARERIRSLLAEEAGIEIAGECPDGATAVAAIHSLRPDLVFLDVQMPEVNGFEVIERLDRHKVPVIVFVTAFDQYAIRAFEVCALDYLLKPFDRERFGHALSRARLEHQRRAAGDLDARLRSMLDEYRGGTRRYLDRLVIRAGGRVVFLPVDELDWVEAAGNYVRLHAGREEYLHRETCPVPRQVWTPIKDGRQLTLAKGYRERLKV
jgi:two-component system, LytTR family, response regulator